MSRVGSRSFSTAQRLEAHTALLSEQWRALEELGALRVGPLLADVLLVYAGLDPDPTRRSEDPVIAALESSRDALGHAVDAWMYVGVAELSDVMELADPAVVIAVDPEASRALSAVMGSVPDVGSVQRFRGRDVMVLGEFPDAVSGDSPDTDVKRMMWERLKRAATLPERD